MSKLSVYDIKEQCIAWWIDVIANPDQHVWTSESPGVCPIVFFASAHLDSNHAPVWVSERSFGLMRMQ